MSRPRLRIGVELGGARTEAAALDAAGRIVARKRQPTSAGRYAGTIAGIVEVIRAVQSQYGMTSKPIVTIGVGIPGAISSLPAPAGRRTTGGGRSRLYRSVPVPSGRVDSGPPPPHHGDSGGLRGAAWPWPRDTADPS